MKLWKIIRTIVSIIIIFTVSIGVGVIIKHCKNKPIPKLLEVIEIVSPSLEGVIEGVIGSVVHISNDTMGWQGSGVLITSDLILTARHVVENGEHFTVTTNDGKEFIAIKALSSKEYDIGFIKFDKPIDIKPAKLRSIKGCKLGQKVFALGSPYGKENFNSVTLGIISGLNRDWETIDSYTGELYGWSVAFTTDAAGHPGNSGCPVFTMDSTVRGILVGGYSPVLIACIPVDLVLDDIEEIEQMFVEYEYYHEVGPQPVYDVYNSFIKGFK